MTDKSSVRIFWKSKEKQRKKKREENRTGKENPAKGGCSPEAGSECLCELYSASLDEIRRETNLLCPKLAEKRWQ